MLLLVQTLQKLIPLHRTSVISLDLISAITSTNMREIVWEPTQEKDTFSVLLMLVPISGVLALFS